MGSPRPCHGVRGPGSSLATEIGWAFGDRGAELPETPAVEETGAPATPRAAAGWGSPPPGPQEKARRPSGWPGGGGRLPTCSPGRVRPPASEPRSHLALLPQLLFDGQSELKKTSEKRV